MTIATTAGQRFDRADGNQPYRPATAARDPREIQIVPGWNVRDMTSPATREHIELLKLSITERGVDKPIAVKYDIKTGIRTLVDGQCRLQACRELWQEGKRVYVPMIEVKGDEAELTAESLTSNAGLPLTQFEIGMGCRKLLDKYHWTKEQVAAHICKSVRYVTEAVMLAEAPAEAKALLADHKVTPGAVLHAIKEHAELGAHSHVCGVDSILWVLELDDADVAEHRRQFQVDRIWHGRCCGAGHEVDQFELHVSPP